MNTVCKMTGEATIWPCSAHGCSLYGDCLSEYAGNSKPISNADRIRVMSDEELAEFLKRVHVDPCSACCDNLYWCRRNNAPEPVCQKHFFKWLQQPAKEGET